MLKPKFNLVDVETDLSESKTTSATTKIELRIV
jgi:hypothetical protein